MDAAREGDIQWEAEGNETSISGFMWKQAGKKVVLGHDKLRESEREARHLRVYHLFADMWHEHGRPRQALLPNVRPPPRSRARFQEVRL